MKKMLFIFSAILFVGLMVSTPVYAIQDEGGNFPGNNQSSSPSDGTTSGNASCEDFQDITKPIYAIIMIGAPSLLLLFGTIDFGRAVAAGDEKEMKKATSDFLKRLIICIVIELLPTLINLIMGFTTFNDLTACF